MCWYGHEASAPGVGSTRGIRPDTVCRERCVQHTEELHTGMHVCGPRQTGTAGSRPTRCGDPKAGPAAAGGRHQRRGEETDCSRRKSALAYTPPVVVVQGHVCPRDYG